MKKIFTIILILQIAVWAETTSTLSHIYFHNAYDNLFDLNSNLEVKLSAHTNDNQYIDNLSGYNLTTTSDDSSIAEFDLSTNTIKTYSTSGSTVLRIYDEGEEKGQVYVIVIDKSITYKNIMNSSFTASRNQQIFSIKTTSSQILTISQDTTECSTYMNIFSKSTSRRIADSSVSSNDKLVSPLNSGEYYLIVSGSCDNDTIDVKGSSITTDGTLDLHTSLSQSYTKPSSSNYLLYELSYIPEELAINISAMSNGNDVRIKFFDDLLNKIEERYISNIDETHHIYTNNINSGYMFIEFLNGTTDINMKLFRTNIFALPYQKVTKSDFDTVDSTVMADAIYSIGGIDDFNSTVFRIDEHKFMPTIHKIIEFRKEFNNGIVKINNSEIPYSIDTNGTAIIKDENSEFKIKVVSISKERLQSLYDTSLGSGVVTFSTGALGYELYFSYPNEDGTMEYAKSIELNSIAKDDMFALLNTSSMTLNKDIPAGYTYVSLPTSEVLCDDTILSSLSTICTASLNSIVSNNETTLFRYKNNIWQYWDTNNTITSKYNLNKFILSSSNNGFFVNALTDTTLHIPYNELKFSNIAFADISKSGWHLVSIHTIMSLQDMIDRVSLDNKVLKYIYFKREDKIFLYDKDTSSYDGVLPVEYMLPTQSIWIYVE